jgi:hypothetical protein
MPILQDYNLLSTRAWRALAVAPFSSLTRPAKGLKIELEASPRNQLLLQQLVRTYRLIGKAMIQM